MTHLSVKLSVFMLLACLAIGSASYAQEITSDDSSNASSRNYWMGIEAGFHSENYASFDHTGEGHTLRLNVLSVPIVTVSRFQVAVTYSHAAHTEKRLTLSGFQEWTLIEKESSVDITGVEFYYGGSLFKEENWNFLVGPQAGIEHSSSSQGGIYTIGLASVFELNSPDQMMQYYIRVFGKTGGTILNFGGDGMAYNVWGVSLGIGFNWGRFAPRIKTSRGSNQL